MRLLPGIKVIPTTAAGDAATAAITTHSTKELHANLPASTCGKQRPTAALGPCEQAAANRSSLVRSASTTLLLLSPSSHPFFSLLAFEFPTDTMHSLRLLEHGHHDKDDHEVDDDKDLREYRRGR